MADEEDDRKLAQSPEMSKFFRALAIANANAVHRVNKVEGVEKKIGRAEEETRRLTQQENAGGGHKCPKGTIWDESLRRCVPLG